MKNQDRGDRTGSSMKDKMRHDDNKDAKGTLNFSTT